VPSARVDAVFSLLLAATVVASMNIVGVTLIAAAIVIPPICARLLSDSFKWMLVLSTFIGAVAGFVGMYLSYYVDIASGASIVLFSAGLFLIVLLYSTLRARLPIGRSDPEAAEARLSGANALYD